MHFLYHCSTFLIPPKKSSSWSPKYSFTYCIYDTFTASKIPTTKLSEQIEYKKGLNLENMGDEEGLGSRIQSQQQWDPVTCEQVHYPARAECLESTFHSSSSQSPDTAASVLPYNMPRLSCDLPQDNQPVLCDYPKKRSPSPSLLKKLSTNSLEGMRQGASTASFAF